MEPPGHQRSMTSMTRNLFFEFLTPKNYPRAFKNHRNVFYSSQGTRWTLKFCSTSIRSKAIGDHGFSSISALDLTSEVTGWPRTLSLYINLFVSRRATHSFFPRSSSSIRGETANGKRSYQPPPPLVAWKDAKWPVPARVNTRFNDHLFQTSRVRTFNFTCYCQCSSSAANFELWTECRH